MQPLAVLIAAGLVGIALVPLARGSLRQLAFWTVFVIGAFAFPIVQWVSRSVWEPLAVDLGLPHAGIGVVVNLFMWAILGEFFKVAPVLLLGVLTEVPRREWFAYGVAAGAGYALFGAQQVITLALEVSRLSVSSPASTALAIVLRLFPILAHIATTAFLAWAASQRSLGRGLLVATAAQMVLGLVERGQASLGTVGGQSLFQVLFALIAVFLFLYVWTLRDRGLPGPSRQPAG